MSRTIALIGARAGSTRIPNKNLRELAGKPLIRYTVDAAKNAGIFDAIWISTDYRNMVLKVDGVGIIDRPEDLSTAESPDMEWVRHALSYIPSINGWGKELDPETVVFLLRPTSPFRNAATILGAHDQWVRSQPLDSMRSVRVAREHPCKQWVGDGKGMMVPFASVSATKHLHERPTNTLVDCYTQTGGLEIFTARTVQETRTLAGERVGMFIVAGAEALDINDEMDWAEAESWADCFGLIHPSEPA